MQPQRSRGVLGDHDLVGAVWVGHPPARHSEAILVEEEPVDAADQHDVVVEAPGLDLPRLHEGRAQRDVTLDVHDLRVPAHGVHELLHVVRLPHAGAAAGGFDHEVRGVRRGQEGRERRRGAAGRRQRPQRDATHEPDEEDEHCVAPPLPSPAGDGSVPERGEGRRARRGVRRGSGRDHPGGRGGGRALHGSSVPDLHRRANEVSRGMHLVVARVPTGRLPPEAGPSGSRGRWQRFEGLYRHPAGALRLVVRLQLAL